MMMEIKKSKKGFTLAELLIVIAIIAVLIAVAVPVFTAALGKAEEQTEAANARSTHAMAVVAYLEDPDKDTYVFNGDDKKTYTWTLDISTNKATVEVTNNGVDPIKDKYEFSISGTAS